MTARLLTPPATLAVTLDSARANLRIDGSDNDALITTWTQGITASVEHELGRALISQTWRVTLDRFPTAIRLEMPPIVSVTAVRYLDVAGVLQTMNPTDYTVDTVSEPGYVVPAPGKAWPLTAEQINAVVVDYTCGHGATPDAVPANVRLYILARLEHDHGPRSQQKSTLMQPDHLARLLDACRVYG